MGCSWFKAGPAISWRQSSVPSVQKGTAVLTISHASSAIASVTALLLPLLQWKQREFILRYVINAVVKNRSTQTFTYCCVTVANNKPKQCSGLSGSVTHACQRGQTMLWTLCEGGGEFTVCHQPTATHPSKDLPVRTLPFWTECSVHFRVRGFVLYCWKLKSVALFPVVPLCGRGASGRRGLCMRCLLTLVQSKSWWRSNK